MAKLARSTVDAGVSLSCGVVAVVTDAAHGADGSLSERQPLARISVVMAPSPVLWEKLVDGGSWALGYRSMSAFLYVGALADVATTMDPLSIALPSLSLDNM